MQQLTIAQQVNIPPAQSRFVVQIGRILRAEMSFRVCKLIVANEYPITCLITCMI